MNKTSPAESIVPSMVKLRLRAIKPARIMRHRLCRSTPLAPVIDRFLASTAQKALQSGEGLPRMALDLDNRTFEVHTLLCGRDVPYFQWSLYSLFAHLPFRSRAYVHSDGTLDSSHKAIISDHFPGITIIDTEEAKQRIDPLLVNYPNLRWFRQEFNYAMKLLDICLLAQSPVLILDSDVLFFTVPEEILSSLGFVGDGGMVYNCEFDNPRYWQLPALRRKFPEVIGGLNSGLLLLNPFFVCKLAELEEIMSWMREHRDSLPRIDEQTVYAILAGRYPSRALSSLYCTIGRSPVHPKDLVAQHYHTVLRSAFALDGIKRLCL